MATGILKRWLIVRNEKATHREQKAVIKNLLKTSTQWVKQFPSSVKPFSVSKILADFFSGLSVLRIEDGGSIALVAKVDLKKVKLWVYCFAHHQNGAGSPVLLGRGGITPRCEATSMRPVLLLDILFQHVKRCATY